MHGHFDIFSGTQANPRWLETAEGQLSAIARMEKRAREIPGRYFVFHVDSHSIVASVETRPSELGLRATTHAQKS